MDPELLAQLLQETEPSLINLIEEAKRIAPQVPFDETYELDEIFGKLKWKLR